MPPATDWRASSKQASASCINEAWKLGKFFDLNLPKRAVGQVGLWQPWKMGRLVWEKEKHYLVSMF